MDEPKELGTLIVVVGKARNLVNKSRFGKQDPFCTVTYAEDKQKTKAIKRGGQHPEWDEELRFTILEDADDLLARKQSVTDSLNSSTTSTASTSKGDAPGVTTAQALATRSRKGPINKKGAKSLRLACYADDAKEPELIGECAVPIDEVLRKGEVDEWYDISYKEKYSGEVYLELTFYSNDAPPVKRNVPRPPLNNYGGAGAFETGQSTLTPPHRLSGGISASGSVSGMSLYIPPYVKSNDVNPTAPSLSATSSFQNLGVPPPARQQTSQQQPLPAQPGFPPQSFESLSADLLTRPMSSLSLASIGSANRPLPFATSAPAQQQGHSLHRHSVGGPAEAPWGSLLPQSQPPPPPAPHARPMSTNDVPWDQTRRLEEDRRVGGATPVPRPVSGQSQRVPWQPQPDPYRATTPMPRGFPNLQPPAGHQTPAKPHANSFSVVSNPEPAMSLYAHHRPEPGHQSISAPVQTVAESYHAPSSSFGGFTHNAQSLPPQPPTHLEYSQADPLAYQRTVPPGGQMQTPLQSEYHQDQQYDTPPRQDSYHHRNSLPNPVAQRAPLDSGAPNTSYPPSQGYHQPAQPTYGHDHQSPPPPNPPPQISASTSSPGYVPWYQQTQPFAPTQAPYQPTPTPQSDPYQPGYGSQPAAVPSPRPIPNPPAPPKNPEGYWYPSDELYKENHANHSQEPVAPPQNAPWQSASTSDHSAQQPSGYEPPYPSQQSPYGASTPAPYNAAFNSDPPPNVPKRDSLSWQSPAVPSYQHTPAPYRAPSSAPPLQSYGRSPSPAPPVEYYGRSPSPVPPRPYPRAPSPAPPQPYPRQPSPAPPQSYPRAPSPAPPAQQSYYTPPPAEAYRAPSPQPYTAQHALGHNTPNTPNQQLNPPNGYAHPGSPSPVAATTGRPDWRSYMQNLSVGQSAITNSPIASGSGRSPSPAPPPKDWYTPPPSLPSSIRPPDGWKSTLSPDRANQWEN